MVNDYTMLKERAFDAPMDFQDGYRRWYSAVREAKDRWFEKFYKAKFRDGAFACSECRLARINTSPKMQGNRSITSSSF